MEDSLLLMEAEKEVIDASPLSERAASLPSSSLQRRQAFDTRTFVIRRPSPASSIQYETASKASTPSMDASESAEVSSVNGGECLPDDGLPMGAEATSEEIPDVPEATDEDDIGMEMDYDNLMAYFENLKESTA